MGNKKILLRKIILRLIIVMFIIIAFIVIVIAVINIYMKSETSSKILSVDECKDMDADCILVLGAGVAPSGKPTWMLEDRILTSEELYNVNASPKIIMSGDHGRVSYDEVNTMKDYAINDGIPSDDIFMDHAGFSTYDSMYRAKEIFGVKKIVIVSQKYHLTRALYIAKKLGIEAYGVSADKRDYLAKQKYRVFREWIARAKDFFKLIYKPEPTYLGDKISLEDSGDITNDK